VFLYSSLLQLRFDLYKIGNEQGEYMQTKPAGSVKEMLISAAQIPSVNKFISKCEDAEREVAQYLSMCAQSYGLKYKMIEAPGTGNNLLITREFKSGAPWIMFAAHMDTVSGDGMARDPFAAEEINGRIYGRGVSDDKGGLCASIWALKETSQEGSCPNNIAVLATVDEEQRRTGAVAFTAYLPSLGFKPSGVIVAEPTLFKPIVRHAGVAHFSVTVKGRAAHASEPYKGKSAIKGMLKVIETIEKEYIANLRAVDPLCGKAQCSINMINGGRQVNAVPDLCVIKIDRRFMPGEKSGDVIVDIEKILAKLRLADPELDVSVNMDFYDDPLSQDIDGTFIQWALGSLKKSRYNSTPAGAQYATDAGEFNRAGLPCVIIGPGNDALSHTAEESIGIDELETGVKIFKALMRSDYTGR
jgi:acetylornithine deacetylase